MNELFNISYDDVIDAFIHSLTYFNSDHSSYVKQNLLFSIRENKDINLNVNSKLDINFFGNLKNELNMVNEFENHKYNIIAVYKSKEIVFNRTSEYFGFIYCESGFYIKYVVNLSTCFTELNSDSKNSFRCVFLTHSGNAPEKEIVDKYRDVKNVIGEKAYNLIIKFMLENTNSKVKNAIYKIF